MSDKLKKWSVVSYVAAVLHAIVLVLLVIEWVAWKADAFRLVSNFIWRFLTTNSATWFHVAMAFLVIVSGGGIVVLFCEAKLIREKKRETNGLYVFCGIINVVVSLVWIGTGINGLTQGLTAYDKSFKNLCLVLAAVTIILTAMLIILAIVIWKKPAEKEEQPKEHEMPPYPIDQVIPPAIDLEFEKQEPLQEQNPWQEVNIQQNNVTSPMGRVVVTSGPVIGQAGYKLPSANKILVGKSRQRCHLIIQDEHISNVHCSIRYNEKTNGYIIKDHSLNGTFVGTNRLPKDMFVEYPAGTVLTLADGKTRIKLG